MTEKVNVGRGNFFAVDRRAWHLVCGLGMNGAVAYLIAARGTGGDNRTTKWSANAIETRTGISRSRAQEAIRALEKAGALNRDPTSKPSHPKYKLVPAHEIRGCEGALPAPMDPEHEQVHAALEGGWVEVPQLASGRKFEQWGCLYPRRIAEGLVRSGHAEMQKDGRHFRAIRFDAEAAARPDWIWLPNALVDGAADEVRPVELIRQTGNVLILRLLVNLYGSQILDENGGIHFRRIREEYVRHKVGEQGALVVWGFVPKTLSTWPDSPFVAPHLAGAIDSAKHAVAMKDFWGCLGSLRSLGLIEFVGQLVHADTDEGEIIHPVALTGTGLEIERELGRAAIKAALMLITPGQEDWARKQGVVMLAPVLRHVEGVQMLGIARLRYRPRTNRTLAFMAREEDWRAALGRLRDIAEGALATSR